MKLSRALRIKKGDVVAFVGGGGKTSAMFRLADELSQASMGPMRVLTTTSTRIFAAQIRLAPAYVIFDPAQHPLSELLSRLDKALAQQSHVLLIGPSETETGKAFGISPETIDWLAASGHIDVLINEADGSRMLPFKAPADHEPVIPDSTTVLVPVMGIDSLNRPLNDENVHRAKLVSRLSGTPLNQPITVETAARVLSHPAGGLKNAPAQARVIPLLNKVESPVQLIAARSVATRLLACPQIEAVAVGAMQAPDQVVTEVHSRTAAVILAAGGSSRFGSPKQLAAWGRRTFIERIVDIALASRAEPVLVILGAEIERSQALLANRPLSIVINNSWAEGQSTSMQSGVAHLPSNVSSVLFLLVDQPEITTLTIDALIARYQQTRAPIVWPEFNGKRGNPVLFDRALFPKLMKISGDIGGKPLLMAYEGEAERVEVTNEGILRDYDRPEDLDEIVNCD